MEHCAYVYVSDVSSCSNAPPPTPTYSDPPGAAVRVASYPSMVAGGSGPWDSTRNDLDVEEKSAIHFTNTSDSYTFSLGHGITG